MSDVDADRILAFMASRLKSMLLRPAIWGSLLSVEERILQLLELRRVLLTPSPSADDAHRFSQSYSRFISEALDDATVEPLASQLEQRGRSAEFSAIMEKFIVRELVEFSGRSSKVRDRITDLERRVEGLEHGLLYAVEGWENLIKLFQAAEESPEGREEWGDDLRIVARLRAIATGEGEVPSLARYVAEIEAEVDRHPDRHPDERDETEAAEATRLISRLQAIVERHRLATGLSP